MKNSQNFPTNLTKGYSRFISGHYKEEKKRYTELANAGQNPEIMIISCCDSRAIPEIIFDCAPGELFIARNVANQVSPYCLHEKFHSTAAALEFAVQALHVKHIVVIGHSQCGGVEAFRKRQSGHSLSPLSKDDHIGKWISLLEPIVNDIRCDGNANEDKLQRAMEEASIRNSVRNIISFPYVKNLLNQSKIHIHGAWFDISEGKIWIMNQKNGDFSPIIIEN